MLLGLVCLTDPARDELGGPGAPDAASSVPGVNPPVRKVNGGWASRMLMRSRSGPLRSTSRPSRESATSSQLLNTRTSGAEPTVQWLAMKTMGPEAASRWLRKNQYENFGSRKMSMQPEDSMSGA